MNLSLVDVPCIMVFPPHNKLPSINKTLAVKKYMGCRDVPYCPKTILKLRIRSVLGCGVARGMRCGLGDAVWLKC